MKAQSTINIETLIPSSLLEEDHSDEESISNCKFEDNLNYQEKNQDTVNHIIYNFQIISIQLENNSNSEKKIPKNEKSESNKSKNNNIFPDLQKPPKEETSLIQTLDLNFFSILKILIKMNIISFFSKIKIFLQIEQKEPTE